MGNNKLPGGGIKMKQLLAILLGVVLVVSVAIVTSSAQRSGVVRDDQDCYAQCRQRVNPDRDHYARAAYEECVKQCERQKWKDIEGDDPSSDK
jgi:hypothetical protein